MPFVALAAVMLASCESTVKVTNTKANLEKVGSHNNVAYAGTPTSLDASGLLK